MARSAPRSPPASAPSVPKGPQPVERCRHRAHQLTAPRLQKKSQIASPPSGSPRSAGFFVSGNPSPRGNIPSGATCQSPDPSLISLGIPRDFAGRPAPLHRIRPPRNRYAAPSARSGLHSMNQNPDIAGNRVFKTSTGPLSCCGRPWSTGPPP
jgi:hypothetical protein